MTDLLLRQAKLVPLGAPRDVRAPKADEPQDILIRDGQIASVGKSLEPTPESFIVDAEGRWVMPGLWDQHVHMTQWSLSLNRLDTSGVSSPQDTLDLVQAAIARGEANTPTGFLTGWGHRSAQWERQPNVAELDAVTGSVPVVLISGDGHHGWLNTAALQRLGIPLRDGIIEEDEWFDVYALLDGLPGATAEAEAGVQLAVDVARRAGVVGIVDLEFSGSWEQWPLRFAAGCGPFRVRTGVYAGRFPEILATGRRAGEVIPGSDGWATQGPLKLISDGSLNTRTAWCCSPYAGAEHLAYPLGRPNFSKEQMLDLVAQAHQAGLHTALHAIGDAAVASALDVFAATGATGSIEHAQLLQLADLPRWAKLPVTASVQPAHLLDDRSVTEQCWPDRTDRTFMVRGLLDQGIKVALGSDAPVAALDPWLAMSSAVHRGEPGAPAWHPEQALSVHQALAASVDGQRVRPGDRGDVILLDQDPLAPGDASEQAAALRSMAVAGTVIGGHVRGPLAAAVQG
ncbi:amidohydrolase [Ornithinimicrobium sp. Arc0846-15]|nr:amidohydrolase [Ornithinimicrobium laminariae]